MYHRNSFRFEDGFGSLFALVITLSLLGLYALVRVSVFLVRTFRKYPRNVHLCASLALFILSLGIGGFLTYATQNTSWFNLSLGGFAALTLTAYIVELRNSQTLLKQPEPMVKAVLGSSWWSDDTQKRAA